MMVLRFLVLICCLSLSSCAILDEFWLGKDNTPLPRPLEPFKPKVALEQVGVKVVGTRAKGRGVFYDLSPVASHGNLISATSGGRVQAIRESDLKLLWRQFAGEELSAGPAVSGGYVALTTVDAELVVLEAANGKQVWKKPLSNQALSKPTISKSLVFVKTVDGHLSAFNLQTGGKQWEATHQQPNVVLRADSSPVVLGDVVLAGFADGELVGFNRYNGQVLWQKQIVTSLGVSDAERMIDLAANPIVNDEKLYVGAYQGRVAAFTLSGFRTQWSHKMSLYQNMALGKRALYVVDANSTIWAIDSRNGVVLWKQGALEFRGVSAPAFDKGRLFVGDKLGYLHVLSAASGKIIGRVRPSRGEELLRPVVANNKVFALDEQGLLKVYKVG